jgi:hypothetical protein
LGILLTLATYVKHQSNITWNGTGKEDLQQYLIFIS